MSMLSGLHIEIPRRNRTCNKAEEPLAPGTIYYSILVEEGKGYQRQDFCKSCWEKEMREEWVPKASGHWKAQVPAKKNSDAASQKKEERALDLLKEALANKVEEEMAEAFILALYLARRKWLILREEIKQSKEHSLLVYEVSETEEMIAVPRPKSLSQIQVGTIQAKLVEKLKNPPQDSK